MAALAENPTLKIIIMSGHADIPLAVRALKSGAVDFIEKPFQADDILAVLEKHLDAGQTSITKSDPADSHLKNNESLSKLTQRETQIAHLLVEGLANKAVAHKLGISVRTVETHRARLMSKLSIRSLSELVKLVILTK
jgi:two-component system response regulator FixJ